MLEDIRTVGKDHHWENFERQWTTLMSYRYLGKQTPMLDAGVERETMPLRHDMRNAVGGVMAAPLCIACPEPYLGDQEAVPAPVIASTQILDDAVGVTRINVIRDVISKGRSRSAFSRATIVDADDESRIIAVSSGMGVSLGEVPEGFDKVDNPPVPVVDSPDLPPLWQVFKATRGDDGWLRLPELTLEQSAPHVALHLGPIHIVCERTAMDVAEQVTGTDALQIESWYIQFVKPGLVGPFRAEGEAYVGRSGRVWSKVTLFDEGKDGRIITTGDAIFRPAG
jgi:hypothetical protein